MITVTTQKHTRHNPLALLDITLKAALCSEKRLLSVTTHSPVKQISSSISGSCTVQMNPDIFWWLGFGFVCFFGVLFVLFCFAVITLYVPNPHVSWGGLCRGLQSLWEPEFSEDALLQCIYCWKGTTLEPNTQ